MEKTKARIDHVCKKCKSTIYKGSEYYSESYIALGRHFTERKHLEC